MAAIIPYFIEHRGCPHRCLFCNQTTIAGDQSPGADAPQDLHATISLWLERQKYSKNKELAFYGGSFTCLPEAAQYELLEAARPYLEKGVIHSIRLSTRPDCLSDDACQFLKECGVRTIELGVQSMDDDVLEKAERGHTVDDVKSASRLLQKYGFIRGIQLMPGLPGETTGTFLRGVRKIVLLNPHFVRIYPALVISNTGLAALYLGSVWRPLSLNRAITLTRLARDRFMTSGINVIRMGLQPSEKLEKSVLAGPYHPAFGELVISRTWYLQARKILKSTDPGKLVKITISDRDYSAFVGPGKQNIRRLEAVSAGRRFELNIDRAMERGQLDYVIS